MKVLVECCFSLRNFMSDAYNIPLFLPKQKIII